MILLHVHLKHQHAHQVFLHANWLNFKMFAWTSPSSLSSPHGNVASPFETSIKLTPLDVSSSDCQNQWNNCGLWLYLVKCWFCMLKLWGFLFHWIIHFGSQPLGFCQNPTTCKFFILDYFRNMYFWLLESSFSHNFFGMWTYVMLLKTLIWLISSFSPNHVFNGFLPLKTLFHVLSKM